MMTGTVGSSVTASNSRFLKRTSSFSDERKAGGGLAALVEQLPDRVESSLRRVKGLVM